MVKNHTVRAGEYFNKEIEDIKKQRLESGIDKKKKSTRVLSNLIVKHSAWKEIKKEIMGLGQAEINKILKELQNE